MIAAKHLSKGFLGHKAVDDVSLEVGRGQIFGLLGPNAAGKTTTIRMMCGIIECDEGEVLIDNRPLAQVKGEIGYVAQYFGQYEELTVWENLTFYARMYQVSDKGWLEALLDRYQLTDFRNRFAGMLSGGYKRRLALACAMAQDPKVLFLDEPTAGIDPVTRKLLWDDFYKLSTEGKTLFVTTHYMEEAQRCHQLAFISSGRIVAEGSPESIKEALGDARVYSASVAYQPQLHDALLAIPGMVLVNQFGDELRMVVRPEVSREMLESSIQGVTAGRYSLESAAANLEDVFIALTQERNAAA